MTEKQPTEFDPADVPDCIADTVRANILADIIGHPVGMPTLSELDYMNPSVRPLDLREELRRMEDWGVVQRVEENSRVFHFLTDAAREALDQYGIFAEKQYRHLYSEVVKPEAIEELEQLPRPPVEASTVDSNLNDRR